MGSAPPRRPARGRRPERTAILAGVASGPPFGGYENCSPRFGEAGAFSDLRASVGGRSGWPPVRRAETVVPCATCSRTGGWQGAASAPRCCPRWGGGAGSPVTPPTEAPSGANKQKPGLTTRVQDHYGVGRR